jgi:hypothetical protein
MAAAPCPALPQLILASLSTRAPADQHLAEVREAPEALLLLLGVRLRRPPRRVYISDLEEGLLTRALAFVAFGEFYGGYEHGAHIGA